LFNSIKGIITHKSAHSIHLENHGIEWILETSATTLSTTPAIGETLRIYTYMHHREDQLLLFGFSSLKERELFMNLITVSGLGPKGARKLLSGVSVDSFIQALEQEDVKALNKLPGLGAKTAGKIILQLRGKLIHLDQDTSISSDDNEWVQSLSAMGFDRKQAEKIVTRLLNHEDLQDLPAVKKEQEIIRRAIMELSS
jgi:Holliday junction DNA helicase RuvA